MVPPWILNFSKADLALFGSPEGVLRYFSLGLFKEPKWLFSHCVCGVRVLIGVNFFWTGGVGTEVRVKTFAWSQSRSQG